MTENPFQAFIDAQGFVLLDGGLATELEAHGQNLNHDLWSAKVLLEDPQSVKDAHLAFLRAGADCIATVTYQASLPGLAAYGLDREGSVDVLRLGITLAVEARNEFWSDPSNRTGRLRPLVASSVGPYGAYLADGSEYSGDYGLSKSELVAFHRERWNILSTAGADLLACETIPSAVEAEAILELLESRSDVPDVPGAPGGPWAWISFSCRDGEHISDGTRLEDAAALCDSAKGVAAVGVNCTEPRFIESLIGEARRGTEKPILVYPNSGETYDARTRTWAGQPAEPWWRTAPAGWRALGAVGIGGCCRVGPEQIAELRSLLEV